MWQYCGLSWWYKGTANRLKIILEFILFSKVRLLLLKDMTLVIFLAEKPCLKNDITVYFTKF